MNLLRAACLFALTEDPTNANHLIAREELGAIFNSLDNGSTWTETWRGLYDTIGSYGVVFDPQIPGRVYVTTATNLGFFRSEDNGLTWVKGLDIYAFVATGQGSVWAFALPTSEFGSTMVKSTDGARTWSKAPGPDFFQGLVVDAADPKILYGVDGDGHLLVTTDDGTTWAQNGVMEWSIRQLFSCSAGAQSVLYATRYDYEGPHLLLSEDRGRTWRSADIGLKLSYPGNYYWGEFMCAPGSVSHLLFNQNGGPTPPQESHTAGR